MVAKDTILTMLIIGLTLFLVLFIFYNPAEGALIKGIREAIGIQNLFSNEPRKELKADESLPQSTTNAQKRFMEEISRYRENGECLLSFSSLSGLGDFKMELTNYKGIISRIGKPLGEGTLPISPIEIKDEKLQVCVINTKFFHDCYLNQRGKCVAEQLYNKVESILVSKDSIIIDGKPHLLSRKFLFKPDKDHLCFIPTHSDRWYAPWEFKKWGCDVTKDTIDDDCIEQIFENNKILLCSS